MQQQNVKTSAIIVAAGKGSRMNAKTNKQYLMLSNRPVLAYTLEAFEHTEIISEIILVIHPDDHQLFKECILPYGFSKITAVVDGGADRQASVYNALAQVSPESGIIAVHDGARPLIAPKVITDSTETAAKYGAACVGVPVKDTIKQVSPELTVIDTPDRSVLWAVQTPQTFQRDILINAHEKALSEGYRGTDDSVLVERLGVKVKMVMGSYANLKITTAEDLVFAGAFLKAEPDR
ncbi:MAG: 2-C-methyl-D-erythritol 4-phosphate cytidylyltransferase [Thermoclostridium sp.]|nr:2-C-methyl-D-erythritol 4-phosphate cytidylyltransferase [Thermoclostridium sp.]